MTKLKQIISSLESQFPLKKAEEWDKPGLQYGDPKQKVERILVALDLTTEVFEEAINKRVDLIITHHPFLWEDTKEENFANAPYKKILDGRLLNTGIALYSMHTNYDHAKNGTAHGVAKRLEVKKVDTTSNVKYARIIEEEMSTHQILNRFKTKFGITTGISNDDTDNTVFKKWAILPGSGDIKDIIKLYNQGIKCIVTSDVKWSDWITIDQLGVKVLEISHGIETVFTEDVAKLLNGEFADVDTSFVHAYEIGKL